MKKLVAGLAIGVASFSMVTFATAQTTTTTITRTTDHRTETKPAGTAPSSLEYDKELRQGTDRHAPESLKAAYKEAEEQYKQDRSNCDKLQGNEKDVCIAKARADRVRARAEADIGVKDTSSARRKALMDTTEAEYKVERAKCDEMKGDAKKACVKKAKTARAAARYEPPTQERAGTVQRPKSIEKSERAGSRGGEPAR